MRVRRWLLLGGGGGGGGGDRLGSGVVDKLRANSALPTHIHVQIHVNVSVNIEEMYANIRFVVTVFPQL